MKRGDFLALMGKGKRCFKHVQTKEDQKDLEEFRLLFERNFPDDPAEGPIQIPEIIHFVWLGPKELSDKSKRHIESFKAFHPGWKIILWSDHLHGLGIEEEVTPTLLGVYARYYEASDNFGEKSDLVRLLVLQKFGGLYVDHDVECKSSFAKFHRLYPIYGGLLTPGNPVIHRSAIVRNSIIGARQGHKVLDRALSILQENWDRIGAKYPGDDVESIKKRVTLRTFAPFHEAVLEAIKEPEFKGIFFPAGCFNEIERKFGLFAKEEMCGSWYTEPMSHHDAYLKERLHKMMKRMHLYLGLLGGLVLILYMLVILLLVKVL